MTRTYFLMMAAAVVSSAMWCTSALAQASAQQAEQLKTTLTPYGAEKAGNADGSIPPYTGGLTTPLGVTRAGMPPVLFENEKPVLQITADKADQHAARLTEGFKHLLKNYPGFRIDVYPTHRTFAAPAHFAANTSYNATHASVVNESPSGHKGGIPFPIPKTGLEVILNSQWNWRGGDRQFNGQSWFVAATGKRSLSTGNIVSESHPYNYGDKKDPWSGKVRTAVLVETTAPAYSAGEKALILGPRDPIAEETQGWTYFTGQRRLRKVPNVQYDVPFPYTSGNTNYDDTYGFNGATDRYEWTLVGKREMYVPYNNNNIAHVADLDKLMGPQFVNPDFVRFELHRVWLVDATLKQGSRHTVPKRRFYIDEDSWNIVSTDQWDGKGQFWKSITPLTFVYPDAPAQALVTQLIYNVQSKAYAVLNTVNAAPGGLWFKPFPADSFTPQSLERSGVR